MTNALLCLVAGFPSSPIPLNYIDIQILQWSEIKQYLTKTIWYIVQYKMNDLILNLTKGLLLSIIVFNFYRASSINIKVHLGIYLNEKLWCQSIGFGASLNYNGGCGFDPGVVFSVEQGQLKVAIIKKSKWAIPLLHHTQKPILSAPQQNHYHVVQRKRTSLCIWTSSRLRTRNWCIQFFYHSFDSK